MVEAEAPENGPGKKNELVVLEPAAGTMLGAGDGGCRRRARCTQVHRLLYRQHPQPEHAAAYAVAVRGFFTWLDEHEIRELSAIRTRHVSAYIETLTRT